MWPTSPKPSEPPRPARCGEPGGARPKKCQDRIAAERAGELIWHTGYDAYVLTSQPLRRCTTAARYYAAERGVDLHDGEPYRWHSCPFCGGDMAAPDGLTFGGGDGPDTL